MPPYGTNLDPTQTASGVDYTLLRTPGTQTYSFQTLSLMDIPNEDFDIYRGIISCNEIATKFFPNSANPREPDNKSVVNDMKRGLRLGSAEKNKFHRYNNGLTIVCSRIDNTQGIEYEIDFEYGDGICNGGHTYFSVTTHPLSQTIPPSFDGDSFVNVEVIVIPAVVNDRRDEVTRIADRRNRSAELDETSKADSRGWYNSLRANLSRKIIADGSKQIQQGLDLQIWREEFLEVPQVSWHENDSSVDHDNPLDPIVLFRWIKAIDPLHYKHVFYSTFGWSTTSNSGQTVSSGGKMHKDWFAVMEADSTGKTKQYLRHMTPLVHDLILLTNRLRELLAPRSGFALRAGVRMGSMVRDWWQSGEDEQNALLVGPMPFSTDPNHVIGAGNAMMTTIPPILLGFYRSNVWLAMPESTLQKPLTLRLPRFVGWMLHVDDTLDALSDFIQEIHTEFMTINDNPAHTIKTRNVLYQEVWGKLFGMRTRPLYPSKFYDRCDVFSIYERSEINDATHIMIRDPGQLDLRIVDLQPIDPQVHANAILDNIANDPHLNHNLYKKSTIDVNDAAIYANFGLNAAPTPDELAHMTLDQESIDLFQ
jgi:hypothetical protein